MQAILISIIKMLFINSIFFYNKKKIIKKKYYEMNLVICVGRLIKKNNKNDKNNIN